MLLEDGWYVRLQDGYVRLLDGYVRFGGEFVRFDGEYVRFGGEYDRVFSCCGMFVVGFGRLVDVELSMCLVICSLSMVAPNSVMWNPSGRMVICLGMLSNSDCVSIMLIRSVFISGSVAFNILFCIISRMLMGLARGGVCTMCILFWFIVASFSVMFLIFSIVSVPFSPLRVWLVPIMITVVLYVSISLMNDVCFVISLVF